eukprot:3018772-Rhodomonas_salina.2
MIFPAAFSHSAFTLLLFARSIIWCTEFLGTQPTLADGCQRVVSSIRFAVDCTPRPLVRLAHTLLRATARCGRFQCPLLWSDRVTRGDVDVLILRFACVRGGNGLGSGGCLALDRLRPTARHAPAARFQCGACA